MKKQFAFISLFLLNVNPALFSYENENNFVGYYEVSDPSIELTPIEKNGRLKVAGPDLVNQNGQAVQLKGISSHGLQWYGSFINYDSIKWLRDDWGISVIRAAMYTAEGGYISNPSVKNKVVEAVDAAIALGIYAIIDWHILSDKDPNIYKSQAIEFFKEMAGKYAGKPNVIYEIANEPNGYASWSSHIKPYANEVIPNIRAIDPEAIVIVGTSTWSQDVHNAADDPLKFSNIMYACHFYAGTHGSWLRDRVDYARNKKIAIFISEWGTTDASGNGNINYGESRSWIGFMKSRKISWANWSLSNKNETSAVLKPGAKTTGGWSDSELSDSGRFVKSQIKAE
ncbi:MAG: glycoside hydrolase family 5 protein [Oligoflexales bacterium]|nr:glycoside hydrolase family 5 protein [Oligoflexales bacterium]